MNGENAKRLVAIRSIQSHRVLVVDSSREQSLQAMIALNTAGFPLVCCPPQLLSEIDS